MKAKNPIASKINWTAIAIVAVSVVPLFSDYIKQILEPELALKITGALGLLVAVLRTFVSPAPKPVSFLAPIKKQD